MIVFEIVWQKFIRNFVACVKNMKREKCTNCHISFMVKIILAFCIAFTVSKGTHKFGTIQEPKGKNPEHPTKMCICPSQRQMETCSMMSSKYIFSSHVCEHLCFWLLVSAAVTLITHTFFSGHFLHCQWEFWNSLP